MKYEVCPSCNGSGLQLADYTGEPTECYECDGDCVVKARDKKGRFMKDDAPPERVT
jgi:DnaJ-class molecular chaperone